MAWKTDDADVMGVGDASELCAESYLACLLEELLLKLDIAEGSPCLIACCGQRVIILS